VMYSPVERLTTQEYDLQFGTNVLGHFYFTKLLLPLLTATAKNAPANSVRVINVSSLGHYLGAPEGIRWDTLARGQESLEARRKLGSARLFGQSKTGNILLSNEIARRYGSEGIVSISLHPGTNLSRHAGSLIHQLVQLFKFAGYYIISCGDLSFLTDESKALTDLNSFKSNVEDRAENAVNNLKSGVEDRAENAVPDLETGELPDMGGIDIEGSHGAITSLYAGTTADAGNLNGKYLTAWARVTLPHPKALNVEVQKRMWDWCEDQVKDIGNKAAS